MITPKDIENPKRKSGFDHVNDASGEKDREIGRVRWRAAAGGKPSYRQANTSWRGRSRDTALEAAQDYCDYINGSNVAPAPTLKTAGHVYNIERAELDPEVEAAYGVIRDYKAQKRGKQGFVYLIVEKGGRYGKIGYSVNPQKRIAEVQTGNPRPLRLFGTIPGTEADERAMHGKYIKDNALQEWFVLSDQLKKEFTNV